MTINEKLISALTDAEFLIGVLSKKIDWDPIPGTWARGVAQLRNNIAKVLAEARSVPKT